MQPLFLLLAFLLPLGAGTDREAKPHSHPYMAFIQFLVWRVRSCGVVAPSCEKTLLCPLLTAGEGEAAAPAHRLRLLQGPDPLAGLLLREGGAL
ncbi:hypothetical protein MC885_009677 [Smutsia gigantea]|nr:hypothetical protein MC885_009677 [Smutsia gigantea]